MFALNNAALHTFLRQGKAAALLLAVAAGRVLVDIRIAGQKEIAFKVLNFFFLLPAFRMIMMDHQALPIDCPLLLISTRVQLCR